MHRIFRHARRAIALGIGFWAAASPASAQSTVTGYWVCLEHSANTNDTYANAPFAAPNDVTTQRHAMFSFPTFVQQQYGAEGTAGCYSYPTPAAAKTALQTKTDWARKQGRRVVATQWVYEP